jgi:hypothetical protein
MPERAMTMCRLLALGSMPYTEMMQAMGGNLSEAKKAYDWLISRGVILTHGGGPNRLVEIAERRS